MSDVPTATVPNGLASLTQKRARRAMPPPRHPPRKSAPDGLGGGAEPGSVVDATPAVEETGGVIAPVSSAEPVASPPVQPIVVPSTEVSSVPAKPATVYLDEPQVNFLEQARIAGLLSSPRLDLSKSAVVRLALRRLQEQLSVEEICAVLRSQPSDPGKTGRKKR